MMKNFHSPSNLLNVAYKIIATNDMATFKIMFSKNKYLLFFMRTLEHVAIAKIGINKNKHTIIQS